MTEAEAEKLFKTIGLGALKYFILKVDPKKTMMFNPKESIDFNGNTGPFIQYTHARIKSILRKAVETGNEINNNIDLSINLTPKEQELIKLLSEFPEIVTEAGENYSPAVISNYIYDLAKEYNQFYHAHPVVKEENDKIRNLRVQISNQIAGTIKKGAELLGIEVPERM
jgi:arginyl-tRNA synthetase